MEYEKYLGQNLIDFDDDELVKIRNMLEFEHGSIIEEWTQEVKALCTDSFDPYSFRGGRKLDKLARKYAGISADITLLMDDIDDELAKRRKFQEEQRYLGKGSKFNKPISADEFLEKEELKTLKYKQNIHKE